MACSKGSKLGHYCPATCMRTFHCKVSFGQNAAEIQTPSTAMFEFEAKEETTKNAGNIGKVSPRMSTKATVVGKRPRNHAIPLPQLYFPANFVFFAPLQLRLVLNTTTLSFLYVTKSDSTNYPNGLR